MTEGTPDHEEILRLRDRVHQLRGTVATLAISYRQLREDYARIVDDVKKIREQVEGMTEADKIATAVAAAVKRDRRWKWTKGQQAFAAFAAVVVLIQPTAHIVTWVQGWLA